MPLGYEWLEGSGKIEVDFKDHVMWVMVNGQKVKIRGEPKLSRTMVSMKIMIKELNKECEGFYVELGMLSLCSQEAMGVVEGLEGVQEDYQELFQEAKELPPPMRSKS